MATHPDADRRGWCEDSRKPAGGAPPIIIALPFAESAIGAANAQNTRAPCLSQCTVSTTDHRTDADARATTRECVQRPAVWTEAARGKRGHVHCARCAITSMHAAGIISPGPVTPAGAVTCSSSPTEATWPEGRHSQCTRRSDEGAGACTTDASPRSASPRCHGHRHAATQQTGTPAE